MRKELYDQRAEAIKECAARGMSKRRAAKELGLSQPTIGRYALRYSIDFNPIPGGLDIDALREAAASGISRKEAASRFGVSYDTIRNAERKLSIKFPRPGKGAADVDRADAMEAMFKAGKTLAEIGEVYGVSRERVRQILSKYQGVTAEDGGQSVRAKIERDRSRARREAASYEKHGCSLDDLEEIRKVGKQMMAEGVSWYRTPLGAFCSQRANANARQIPWKLKLWEWWQIWQQSGKWDQRGRSGDAYVMCRFADAGAYEVGNVYIATLRHNSTIQPNNPNRLGRNRGGEARAAA